MSRKRSSVKKPVTVTIPITQAMEMHRHSLADIRTGEIKLTAKGRKALGKSAVGVRMVITGME
jgi:hypothetical protein